MNKILINITSSLYIHILNLKDTALTAMINKIVLLLKESKYLCYTMLSSEISKLYCLWAHLDQESYRRSKKNVDCS